MVEEMVMEISREEDISLVAAIAGHGGTHRSRLVDLETRSHGSFVTATARCMDDRLSRTLLCVTA
jgi:hypothetical protein